MAAVRAAWTAGRATPALVLLAAAAMSASGCGPRVVPAAAPDRAARLVSRADAASGEGCYRCLESALESYEDALQLKADAAVAARAYRIAVQLAVRERLIGLYPGAYQEAPARLAVGGAPADVAIGEDVLAGVAWRRGTLTVGLATGSAAPDFARLRARRTQLEATADVDAWQAALLLALIGTNQAVALDDGQRQSAPSPRLSPELWQKRHPLDATLTFTRLTLLRSSLDDWHEFESTHPSFVESWAVIGEGELARGRLLSADEAFARVLDALPALVPALVLRGDIRQRMEDYETALTSYDALLQRLPEHREALLGRVKSLGFAGRHEEAVAAADRMIALGTWYIGEAQYWKAWNLFNLRVLGEARVTVDAARSLMVNADLNYLGAVIAFRQYRLDDALKDFDAAIELEVRHCESHFDRAALHLVRQEWARATTGFDEAYECHQARTPTLEQRIVDAREARLPETVRAALVQRRERALRDHLHQLAWARYNAAVAYANIGSPDVVRARVADALRLGGPAVDAARDLLTQLSIREP